MPMTEDKAIEKLQGLVRDYLSKLQAEITRLIADYQDMETFSKNDQILAQQLFDKYQKCLTLNAILNNEEIPEESKEEYNLRLITKPKTLSDFCSKVKNAYQDAKVDVTTDAMLRRYFGKIHRYKSEDYKKNRGLGYHRHSSWDAAEDVLRGFTALLATCATIILAFYTVPKAAKGQILKRTQGEQLIEQSEQIREELNTPKRR